MLETKGGQRAENPDRAYTEAVPSAPTDNCDWNQTARVGEIQPVVEDRLSVHSSLVLLSDVPTQLPGLRAVP